MIDGVGRRDFLKGVFSGLSLLGSYSLLGDFLSVGASESKYSERNKVLLFIYLPGGYDGLDITIPYKDADFKAVRPTLNAKYTSGQVYDLDGYFGLANSCTGFYDLYKDGSLAIVPAAGNPTINRSHFTAQKMMYSGFSKVYDVGWMNKVLTENPSNNFFRAVNLGNTIKRVLKGPHKVSSFTSIASSDLAKLTETEFDILNTLYNGYDKSKNELGAVIKKFGTSMFDAEEVLHHLLALGEYKVENGANYGDSRFAGQMKTIANLVKNTPIELMYLQYSGGFDTHQRQNIRPGFQQISNVMKNFYQDLGERANDVTVIIGTEFGRTIKENANLGTDHGFGATWYVMNPNVRKSLVYDYEMNFTKQDIKDYHNSVPAQCNYGDLIVEALSKHMGYKHLDRVFPDFDYIDRGVFS